MRAAARREGPAPQRTLAARSQEQPVAFDESELGAAREVCQPCHLAVLRLGHQQEQVTDVGEPIAHSVRWVQAVTISPLEEVTRYRQRLQLSRWYWSCVGACLAEHCLQSAADDREEVRARLLALR